MKWFLLALMFGLGALGTRPLVAAVASGGASPSASRRVLIEAVILEVTRSAKGSKNAFGTGVSHNTNSPALTWFVPGAAPNAASGQLSDLGYAAKLSNDFDSALTALSRDQQVRILQRPRILTSHGVPATLFIGESRPISRGSESVAPSAVSQIEVGTTFEVTPLIDTDRLVVLNMRLEISRFGGNVMVKNVGLVPVANSREARAQLRVRDQDTVVLGGLLHGNKKPSTSALQFPKDLPVPSALFSCSSERHEKSELLVLVRPTLLADKDGAQP